MILNRGWKFCSIGKYCMDLQLEFNFRWVGSYLIQELGDYLFYCGIEGFVVRVIRFFLYVLGFQVIAWMVQGRQLMDKMFKVGCVYIFVEVWRGF